MDCSEINDSQRLIAYFRHRNETELNRVFKCFFNLFYDDFKRLTYKYCSNKPWTKYKEEELCLDTFQDGLLLFYQYLKINGFEDRGARIKTFFFNFCINKLKESVTDLGRRTQREKQVELKDELVVKEDIFEAKELLLILDGREEVLLSAFEQLGERRTNLLKWKKILKLDNVEIAKRLNIGPGTVANEVYRAFVNIKVIVQNLNGNNQKY